MTTRNLLVFGGLIALALGWGSGLVLGKLKPPSDSGAAEQVRMIDADSHAPKEEEGAPEKKEEKSSLLETVFGLEDLEEEPASKPKPPPRPTMRAEMKKQFEKDGAARAEDSSAAPRAKDSAEVDGSSNGDDAQGEGSQQNDEPDWKTEDGLTQPDESNQKKGKKLLPEENPYK